MAWEERVKFKIDEIGTLLARQLLPNPLHVQSGTLVSIQLNCKRQQPWSALIQHFSVSSSIEIISEPHPSPAVADTTVFEATMAGTSAQNHTTAKFGGYPSRVFIRKGPSELTCLLCTEALKDAHLTTCCRQHYCLPCLTKWHAHTEKPTCPHCRSVEPNFSRVRDLRVDDNVKQLQVQCKCCEKCKRGGTPRDTKLQLKKNCCHCQRKCPNMCGETVYHRDLSKLAQWWPVNTAVFWQQY